MTFRKWLKRKLLPFLRKYFQPGDGDPPLYSTPVPVIPAVMPDPDKPELRALWFEDAGVRVMNALSVDLPPHEFIRLIERSRDAGATVITLYLLNAGDGKPPYTSPFYGEGLPRHVVDLKTSSEQIKIMTERCKWILEKGLDLEFFIFPDDSPSITSAPTEVQVAAMEVLLAGFGHFTSRWVVGLELNEYFGRDHVEALAKQIKRLAPHVRLGTHQTSGQFDYSHTIQSVDVCYYQINPDSNAEFVSRETTRIVRKSAKPVVMFEYDHNCDSENFPVKQAAAIRAGALGA